jgi:hypothetical protein
LDYYILDSAYVDNRRNTLLEFGLDTKNPGTTGYLEIDRYYYEQKIAIEINGQQHYKATKHWCQDRVNDTMALDLVKKQLLKEQGVKLIEIRYNLIGKSTIYQQLEKAEVGKLRETAKVS